MSWFSKKATKVKPNVQQSAPATPEHEEVPPELVPKARTPSRATRVKSQLTKHFMEEHFKEILSESHAENDSMNKFRETLNRTNLSPEQRKSMEIQSAVIASRFRRMKRRVLRNDQFERLKLIGKGEFGDVYLVRDKEDSAVYAMKILRKSELIAKGQIRNTLTERDLLGREDNPWNVKLYYSFQDNHNVYFVMEYLPGGDLMNVLIKKEYLTEEETRFYIAETVLALHEIHKAGFIHRDVKPDNILLTRQGHVRLTDYGLSTSVDRNDPLTQLIDEVAELLAHPELSQQEDDGTQPRPARRRDCITSTVGTPDYIAPEVLLKQPYTNSVDFWSVGAIMYEMLLGQPPFLANSGRATAINIIHWRETLQFPEGCCSEEAVDLMRNLLCDAEHRLTFEQILKHPFFEGVNWETIGQSQPPYVPPVESETDTQNFDEFEPRPEEVDDADTEVVSLAFSGFRYNRKVLRNSIPINLDHLVHEQLAQFEQEEKDKEKQAQQDQNDKFHTPPASPLHTPPGTPK